MVTPLSITETFLISTTYLVCSTNKKFTPLNLFPNGYQEKLLKIASDIMLISSAILCTFTFFSLASVGVIVHLVTGIGGIVGVGVLEILRRKNNKTAKKILHKSFLTFDRLGFISKFIIVAVIVASIAINFCVFTGVCFGIALISAGFPHMVYSVLRCLV